MYIVYMYCVYCVYCVIVIECNLNYLNPRKKNHLKRTKGVYLLGRCEDLAEALRRKLALIARFHFDPAMIRIHPDNGGDKMLYGAKVLGSYVGSEESIFFFFFFFFFFTD